EKLEKVKDNKEEIQDNLDDMDADIEEYFQDTDADEEDTDEKIEENEQEEKDGEETNSENNDGQEDVQANSKAPKEEPADSDQFADPTSGHISSGFGGRDSPGGFGSSDHKGIDISTSKGSTVSASASGVISTVKNGCSEGDSSCGGGFGNFIVVLIISTVKHIQHYMPICQQPMSQKEMKFLKEILLVRKEIQEGQQKLTCILNFTLVAMKAEVLLQFHWINSRPYKNVI